MNRAKINERITAGRVILINEEGVNQGEMPKYMAVNLAKEAGLDLVEVSPGIIPTCKLLDYGKLQYQKSKAEKHQKHAPTLKEVRISYTIGEHDLEIKKKKIKEFLDGGHKVLFAMQVKGREKYVAGQAAKEKFISVVKDISPNAKLFDISTNDKGWNIVLHP